MKPAAPRLPPRWFIRAFWVMHRVVYSLTLGRMGLWRAKPGRWGTLRLRSIGRRSGNEHSVILGYYDDGPNLITMAMNGWSAPEPAWWLNLQANPEVTVDLPGGQRRVRARAAQGEERSRLWARFSDFGSDVEAYASLRPAGTAVVVLEPVEG